jgi:hypothetical protein
MSKNATSGDRHKNESTEDKPTASPHPDKKRWFGDAISVFTALLTIATFLLVFVGLLQWSTLEKTDLTQRMINRAFIVPVITGVNLDVSHNLGVKLWTWVPQWENAGNTSSVNLTVETHCGGLPFAADEPRFEEHPGKPGKRVIGPHQRALGVICAFDAAGMQKHLDGTYLFTRSFAQGTRISSGHRTFWSPAPKT